MKKRHQKFFNEKFPVTDNISSLNEKSKFVIDLFTKFLKNSNEPHKKILNKDIKKILIDQNLYNGVFYCSTENLDIVNGSADIYPYELLKLDKNDGEYVKFFVVASTEKNTLIVTSYNNVWSKFDIGIINTEMLGFEGNILISLL